MGRKLVYEEYLTDDGRFVTRRVYEEAWSPEQTAPATVDTKEFQHRKFLDGLLRRCGVAENDWILNRFDPERILLVCCYALHNRKHGKTEEWRRKPAKPLVLHLFTTGNPVDDHRAEILDDITGRQEKARIANEAATAGGKIQQAAQQEFDFAERAKLAMDQARSTSRPAGGSRPRNGR